MTRREARALISRHHGKISAIAEELSMTEGRPLSRQAVALRIATLGLLEVAQAARQRACIPGGRPGADLGVERARVAREVGRCKDRDEAARRLGISRRTLVRRMSRLGIAWPR